MATEQDRVIVMTGSTAQAILIHHRDFPEIRAEGETVDHIPTRFTQKDSFLYVTLLGDPKTGRVTLKNLAPKAGSSISLLGENEALAWVQRGEDVEIKLPSHLVGHYAYVLKMSNPKS